MSEEETKANAAKRGSFKASLTRLKNRLTTDFLSNASLQMLQLLEERATNNFGEYENFNILINDNEDPTNTENCYLFCVEAIRKEIASRRTVSDNNHCSISKLKLPNVQINPFDGKYLEYRPFIEMFTALIHNDKNIDDVQKFFYLRNFLKGEAYDLIKNMPVVGSSYIEALSILKTRYDNKYRIIFEHVFTLIDLASMGNNTCVTSLRQLISQVKQHVAALKNLGEPIDQWNSVLVCLLIRKIDAGSAKAYYLERDNHAQPTLSEFLKFLEQRAFALENSEGNKPTNMSVNNVLASANNVVSNEVKCIYCGKCNHKLYLCPSFMLSTVTDRLNFVKNKKLCKLCLNSHKNRCKFHFKCQQCKQSHNTLLHKDSDQLNKKESGNVSLLSSGMNQVLLPTAKVKLISKKGKEIIVKALLDSGSQTSFITVNLAKRLGKPLMPTPIEIVGIANTEKNVTHSLQVDVFSCVYPFKARLTCFVVDKITTKLPQNSFDICGIAIPQNIKLADDSFHISSEIDILLAVDIFFQALLPQPEELQNHDVAKPLLLHTYFGCIVAGRLLNFPPQKLAGSFFCQECQNDINKTVNSFWQTESVPEVFEEHTSEQQYCEKYFKETVKLINNKFTVSIPIKVPICDVNNLLGDSLGLAMKRFLNLEKRLHKDHQLFLDYQQFIHEYVALGHATYIDISHYDLSKDAIYFLPHHPVIRKEATSTKLRTVFDGSMKASNKISLNDIILNGPIVQPELFDILLSFRLFKYFFICDIRRMFRNILLDKKQRSLQNILWRDSPEQSIQCIQLNTVTYGLKNSPYLATRCLNELADRFQSQYPKAASVLLNSTYVDDILHTDNDKSQIIKTMSQLSQLLSKGSFDLHKWASNDKEILSSIPTEQQVSGEKELKKDIKTLGLKFDLDSDSFILSCSVPNQVPKTKRQILSFVSQFYDPLGIAGPVFVQAKVIIQKLWQANVDWDSIPPPPLEKEWYKFYTSLINMPPIKIKRNVCIDNYEQVQLIGFSDSSIIAYGCAIFIRVFNKQGNVRMSLLCSKSRIAPKDNKLSVPRLELNSALLMAKLVTKVYNTLSKKISIQGVHLYSDSQVVLAWLKTDPTKLKSYIANRIKLINQYTNAFDWLYIKTDQNPADCLSRGVSPSELQCNQLWWSGPAFMMGSNYNPKDCNINLDLVDVPELTS